MSQDLTRYGELITQIRARICQTQVKATLSANAEMILMYWDIGRMIHERQQREGWGAKVIPQLSRDIRNELPEVKGFSKRNIGYMIQFAREYDSSVNLQQPVAKLLTNVPSEKAPQAVARLTSGNHFENLQQLLVKIPWGHHILLMEKIKDLPVRLSYMCQTIEQGWSRNVLGLMIKSKDHERQGEVDDRLKHENDQSTIGLILCQENDRVLAKYALRDIQKPIGISEYEVTRALPDDLNSSLPTVEEIEAELSGEIRELLERGGGNVQKQ